MCGIIGGNVNSISFMQLYDSLKKINHRGNDGLGLYYNGDISTFSSLEKFNSEIGREEIFQGTFMVHLLHSMVGEVSQPIAGDKGVIVANCEIYNWKELKQEYSIEASNDVEVLLKLIELKGEDKIEEVINMLDGVFSFAYFVNSRIYIARDPVGVKPLFYEKFLDGSFMFASERKALTNKELINIIEPGNLLIYDTREKTVETNTYCDKWDSFSHIKEFKENKPEKEVKELIREAIIKRFPEKDVKVGVLFSGGVDSTLIAKVLQEEGLEFTCYTSYLKGGNIEEASDYYYAKKVASTYGFPLKAEEVSLEELKGSLKDVISLLETSEYLKVSVAMPFYFSCKRARNDRVKAIFSGLGAEELFAGYRRHIKSSQPQQECINGINILHDRDLYRDDLISMYFGMEVRLPYLDIALIKSSLNVPINYKLDKDSNYSKIILRKIVCSYGIEEEFAWRKKKAAQYGSKFDKGLLKLAKDKDMEKQEFIDSYVEDN